MWGIFFFIQMNKKVSLMKIIKVDQIRNLVINRTCSPYYSKHSNSILLSILSLETNLKHTLGIGNFFY